MTKDDLTEAIFGSFDGLTSCLGVVAGLIASHVSSGSHILAAAFGLAIAATIGMAAGQYLSEEKGSLRKASVMGVATLIGSVLPALPFIFGASLATILASGLLTLVAATFIGHYRGYKLTYGILVIVSVLTVLVSMVV